jgi:hypothetical protein
MGRARELIGAYSMSQLMKSSSSEFDCGGTIGGRFTQSSDELQRRPSSDSHEHSTIFHYLLDSAILTLQK